MRSSLCITLLARDRFNSLQRKDLKEFQQAQCHLKNIPNFNKVKTNWDDVVDLKKKKIGARIIIQSW